MKQRTRPTITRTTISNVKYTFTKENPSFLNTLVNENNITKQRLNSNKNAKILQINIHQCEQLEYINKGTRKYHVYYRKCHPMKQTTNKHINKGT